MSQKRAATKQLFAIFDCILIWEREDRAKYPSPFLNNRLKQSTKACACEKLKDARNKQTVKASADDNAAKIVSNVSFSRWIVDLF